MHRSIHNFTELCSAQSGLSGWMIARGSPTGAAHGAWVLGAVAVGLSGVAVGSMCGCGEGEQPEYSTVLTEPIVVS
jgi:hypothetical protein